jgi:arylsulfatase A-like enzyme
LKLAAVSPAGPALARVDYRTRPAGPKLNVVVIMSDQHNPSVSGCYGHKIVRTPHIDSLAERGVMYRNAFCASPLCSPSRVAWLTGTHPHTNGVVTHNNSRHRSGKTYRATIKPGIRSLLCDLREAGYATHGSGFIHADQHVEDTGRPYPELGFTSFRADAKSYGDLVGTEVQRRYNMANTISEMWEHTYRNVEGEPFPYGEEKIWDSVITDDSLAFLDGRSGGDPFFLYVGYRAPHPPWCAPKRFHDLYSPDAIGDLPNTRVTFTDKPRRVIERVNYYELWNLPEEMVRKSIAAYFGFVSYTDFCIGRILRKLEEKGLLDNTLVVYTSDHGEMLYKNGICEKHTFFEDAVRIPLIVSLPGTIPQSRTSEALISNIDLLPSVLALAGVAVPETVEGKNIAPTWMGGKIQDHVFAEYYHSLDPCRMVRDDRFKYIHTEDDICELYDLANDPRESINLAWYPRYAERVRRMEKLVMADWEIPQLPVWAAWNDLNERKQRLRLGGAKIIDPRPDLPAWAGSENLKDD